MEPEKPFIYALADSLDKAINTYEKLLEKNKGLQDKDKKAWETFVRNERLKIRTAADLQAKNDPYKAQAASMDEEELEDEVHDSGRLGDNMRAEGFAKPSPYWHAHAMISGGDTRAWFLRTVLAEYKIRIDFGVNGCWLPRSTRYCGQKPYPKAVPHSRIHRFNYYQWLNHRFRSVGSYDDMLDRLRATRRDLLNSSFPPEVMRKKGDWKTPYDRYVPTA